MNRNIKIARQLVRIARELVSGNEKIEVFDFNTGEITANIRAASRNRNAFFGAATYPLATAIAWILQKYCKDEDLYNVEDEKRRETIRKKAIEKANSMLTTLMAQAEKEMKDAVHALGSESDYVFVDSHNEVDVYRRSNGTRCVAQYITGVPKVVEENGVAYVTGIDVNLYSYEVTPSSTHAGISGGDGIGEILSSNEYDEENSKRGNARTLEMLIERLNSFFFKKDI